MRAISLLRLWVTTLRVATLRRVFVPAQSGVDVPVAGRADAQAEYYTLQGVRVVKPSRGLYIRRHGSTVTKVFVK